MDGDFDDEEISFTSSDTDSIIGQWERSDVQIPEDSQQTGEQTNVPDQETFNLLDPGLSRDDKIPEKIKNYHDAEKAEGESKKMPENIENNKETKESKDKTKPHYLTILDRIRADKKTKEEKIKILCKEMGMQRRNAAYILDNPDDDPELARKIGIRFAEPLESDHLFAAELEIDPKEVAYMRQNESKNLQDLMNQKEMAIAMEILRRRTSSPVEDPHQVSQLAEHPNQAPEILLDASGFPPCMPVPLKRKRQEIRYFQEKFNPDWALMVLRTRIDPLKSILMSFNPSETTFPPQINTGRHTSIESILKLVDDLDPAKVQKLARNPSLIKKNFDISRDPQEKFFEHIIAEEDARYGLHPNMTPELRQKRVDIVGFQARFDRDWAQNVYNLRHHPLRLILSRLNPVWKKATTQPEIPLKVEDRMFFDYFPDVDKIIDFVHDLDPTKVYMLADNPHLYNDRSFILNRDEDERNFEEREAARKSGGNQLLMQQAEVRKMHQEASTPVPTQEPPKPPNELAPLTPKNGMSHRPLTPLTPISGASSGRNSFTPLGPIRGKGPLTEPTQSEPGLGPIASSGGRRPAVGGGSLSLGSTKPRPGPLTPTSLETGRPKPSGSRPLAETGNAKPTLGPFGGKGKPLGPIGGCKSTPETGNRKDPFGSPTPVRGNDKPRKSPLGPLAPIGALSKDMYSTTSTFGPMKHPLFD